MVLAEVNKREPLNPSWAQWYGRDGMYNWLFCCCPSSKREDKLFKHACAKLNKEIDIVELAKIARIVRFQANQNTTRRQRELINYFEDYTVNEAGTNAEPVAAQRIFGENIVYNKE